MNSTSKSILQLLCQTPIHDKTRLQNRSLFKKESVHLKSKHFHGIHLAVLHKWGKWEEMASVFWGPCLQALRGETAYHNTETMDINLKDH